MHTQILPYKSNPAELFDHFAHLPHAVFLDSCLPQQNQGRYDVMSAIPRKIIECDESKDIFEEIQNALQQTHSLARVRPKLLTKSPFTIGAIGYLSYDIGRQLEIIPNIANDDVALPKAVVGIYDWSIVVDHLTKITTLHAINREKANQILTLLNTKPILFEPFALTKPFASNRSKSFYQNAFDEIKKNIIAGNCYQVNLAQRFSAQFSGSAWNAYKILREKNPAPFSAFLNFCSSNDIAHVEQSSNLCKSGRNARVSKRAHSILCCSPERFLKIENNIVETKPIKGTSKRFSDPTQDQQSATELLNSEKDRTENVMIVDLLRNDLSRTCTDVTVQQLCALESFSNVHHLVSTITGKLSDNTSAIDVFKNCFPGGSITGAPKIAAMKIIESLESHRRSIYCGSIFYADINGNFDSNIVIRTAICDDNNIHCYAGGGIIYDSQCDEEYAEIQAKIGRMIATLKEIN